MPSLWQRMKGNFFLGYRALLAHPLKKLRARGHRSGMEQFLANYGPEGNLVTSPPDRALLLQASRCIQCGLCDAHDVSTAALSPTVFPGPSALPIYARATPDLPLARKVLEHLEPERLRAAEAVCPTRVPLAGIAEYLRRKLEDLDRVKQDAAQP